MASQQQVVKKASSQLLPSPENSPEQKNGTLPTDHSELQPSSPHDSPDTSKKYNHTTKRRGVHFRRKIFFLARAYGGSLLLTSIGFPIFASAATVCFFLAPPITLPLFYLDQLNPNWYAPVYGFLTSCLALLLFAAFRSHFATEKGANMSVHELLKNRHAELKARLGDIDISKYADTETFAGKNHQEQQKQQEQYKNNMKRMQRLFNVETDNSENRYAREALRRAYEAYCDLDLCLFHHHAGIEWELGTGYTNAWRIVHRAQEALVGIETIQEVIGEVIHDVRSIQSTALSDRTALVRKLLQAVKDLYPEALAYFEELQADKNYADLLNPPSPPARKPLLNFLTKRKCTPPAPSTTAEEVAREAIRQVKHTLNLYQDTLRETLVRIRNRVLISIALTGFVTYFLLNTLILWHTPSLPVSTATYYYIVGAISGLFVRFYNESNNKEAPEDYGLFVSRLIATPLLSGLAGVGGVIVTATISTLGGSGANLSLNTIFHYPVNLDYLIAAAIFGYAPNLIIGTLQQRAQKYSTDLQNSKGEGTSKDE